MIHNIFLNDLIHHIIMKIKIYRKVEARTHFPVHLYVKRKSKTRFPQVGIKITTIVNKS